MAKRLLTENEIAVLEARGSSAQDWTRVRVSPAFTPGESFHRVRFSGDVQLGVYRSAPAAPEGFASPPGIEDSSLHNVSVGDNCSLRAVHAANADIGDDVLLHNVGSLSREGDALFAHDSFANVLAEDGARAVPLTRLLTAQMAHLICHLKGHPAAKALEAIVNRDADALKGARCVVSSGCRIRHSATLRNVWLEEGTQIEGAAALVDCYAASTRSAPARIGEGVAATECVFLPDSHTTGGVRLKHCLVGEGVSLESAFSGKHSLFFANSEFALGEAACAMAGPFAVSHHRATLILTCQCSFNTFGSGANSSNHHFKLGPLHGGVLRRGVRCGSSSYIFWPSDIGAFSTVVGRHPGHLETVDFPFSLVLAKGDMTVLVPGVNLFTSGMFRDARKWRERDRRTSIERPRDLVNPAILSPYVLQAMEAGKDLLERSIDMGVDLRHGGAVVPAHRFKPALRLYRSALTFHIGEILLARAQANIGGGMPRAEDVARVIATATAEEADPSAGKWRDWGGMLLSGVEADAFLTDLEEGRLHNAEEIRLRLERIHAAYADHELRWLAWRWRKEYGAPTPESVILFAEKWRKAVLFRHECFVKDASKEFSPDIMPGFGVEGDAAEAFHRVRGHLSDHALMAQAEAERESLLGLVRFILPGAAGA